MEGESMTRVNSSLVKQSSSSSKPSFDSISILVVDDDTTCLTIVAAILKKFKYQVKHPNDALAALRNKSFTFDLVVADVHMPDMNGFQLQEIIAKEFNLPVVLMSADDKEHIAKKGLEGGAAFFILKPVMADDLRDLWQFATRKKNQNGKRPVEETSNNPPHIKDPKTTIDKTSANNNNGASSSGHDQQNLSWKDAKRKSPKKDSVDPNKKGESSRSCSLQKKPKVIWTTTLHNRFLDAIRIIGLERAVPKKILELMNISGITREHVASHLQKYRIFLRRVSDASCQIQYPLDKAGDIGALAGAGITPSFDFTKSFPRQTLALDPHPGASPLFPGPVLPSSSNIQLGFGQSRLLLGGNNNKGNNRLIRPSTGNPNPINQTHFQGFHNSFQPSGSSLPGLEDSNLALEGFSTRPLSPAYLNTSFLSSPMAANPNPSFGIPSRIGTFDGNVGNYSSNYVGYSLSGIQQLYESGKTGQDFKFNESNNLDLAGCSSSSSFMANRNGGGELLSDGIANYQTPAPSAGSTVPMNQGLRTQAYPFDLSEVDNLTNQQSSTFFDNSYTVQQNFQNQLEPQQGQSSQSTVDFQAFDGPSTLNEQAISTQALQANNNVPNNSMEFSSMSHHLNQTLLMNLPPEHEEDEFLQSLFAPFGEDQNNLDGL
ncbi:two-component response regulator ORR21-like [Andrographis paniculata]|uniref:two-component response regulator ORR21-like n=1 Tax=Andrographis paniculata TaxID=175694 RepID=UPI0021E6F505|nr:two-component response regulator ORR21-like [Andrographis paniculata]